MSTLVVPPGPVWIMGDLGAFVLIEDFCAEPRPTYTQAKMPMTATDQTAPAINLNRRYASEAESLGNIFFLMISLKRIRNVPSAIPPIPATWATSLIIAASMCLPPHRIVAGRMGSFKWARKIRGFLGFSYMTCSTALMTNRRALGL